MQEGAKARDSNETKMMANDCTNDCGLLKKGREGQEGRKAGGRGRGAGSEGQRGQGARGEAVRQCERRAYLCVVDELDPNVLLVERGLDERLQRLIACGGALQDLAGAADRLLHREAAQPLPPTGQG